MRHAGLLPLSGMSEHYISLDSITEISHRYDVIFLIFFSQRMRECVEKILSKDLELYSRQDLSVKLWKGAVYPVIEKLRSQSE